MDILLLFNDVRKQAKKAECVPPLHFWTDQNLQQLWILVKYLFYTTMVNQMMNVNWFYFQGKKDLKYILVQAS